MNAMNEQSLEKEYKLLLQSSKKLPGEKRNRSENINNNSYLERQSQTESNARSYPRRLPFALTQAKGIYLKDSDDNIYFDCLSGAGALALGHNHPVVQKAIYSTIESNVPLLTLDITTPIKDQFVEEIFSILPKEFSKNAKIQFCGPSGSDAVEAAIKLVKIATGRRGMYAFHGGYHGMTNGSLSMMGNLGSKNHIPGLMADVHFLPYSYTYRCPMKACESKCNLTCSNYIENIFNDVESGIVKPAGLILEAIQGEGGVIPSDDEWLRQVRKITKENDVPMILDEVQTGLGRTGKMFAFEHSGITPDVLVLSKAIGGSLPMAVVIYNKDLDKWTPGSHAGTFRGNQMAMATGIATINYMKENNLLDHVNKMSEKFFINLRKIQSETSSIGDVRGRGLMIGMEINNKAFDTATGQNRNGELARLIQAECFDRGLIIEVGGRGSCVLRLLPPLIINEEQVDQVCSIFSDALKEAESKFS